MLKLNLNNVLLAAAMLTLPLAAAARPRSEARVRWSMGTLCEIDAPGASGAVIDSAFAEIERWDRVLSLHKTESEASALNRLAGAGPTAVSSDLYAAVEASLRLARETGGAFDPTLRRGGWSMVRLDPRARTIDLPAGMSLDYGGIGKGWALDKAGVVLRKAGVARALINFGGQILTLGSWPVSIPGQTQPLLLTDASISVSGDTERPAHILSPFNGRPVRRFGSVAAVLPNAAEADAWSTALFVLGKAPPSFKGRSFFDFKIPAATNQGGRS